MSNKSGASPQVLPLPQGGGALRGIGETFAPDLFTGTGNLTVPVALPAGRNGFQPQVNLVYSSGSGNGPFGLGWSISLPGVSRKTARGVPRYRDQSPDLTERDTFVLGGAEDLVMVSESAPGVQRYRPRVEGLFALIERVQIDGADFWRVTGKDGSTSRYGTRASEGADATLSDPQAPERIAAWQISETVDLFGNRIVYEYERDGGRQDGATWQQIYLRRIRYVDFGAQEADARFLVSVAFEYEARPDEFSDFRTGFEVRTRRRCTEIRISTHADRDELVRSYRLLYVDQQPGATAPVNGVSLLTSIEVVGHDGEKTMALPPLRFGYAPFEPGKQRFRALSAKIGRLPERSLADPSFELVSLSGNGLPDLVQIDGAPRRWRNLGRGVFDGPSFLPGAPALHLSDDHVQLADVNGDGRTDLVTRDGYFPLGFHGEWSERSFVPASSVALPFGDPTLRLVDLDGDGVVDALQTGPQFAIYANRATRGWAAPAVLPQDGTVPDVNFSDPRIKVADLNGDGLQDIVRVSFGKVEFWPYMGHGRWAPAVVMRGGLDFGATVPEQSFDPQRVIFADFDGDGVDDLAYVSPNRLWVWINRSGRAWSELPVVITNTPDFPETDAVRAVDLFGSGMQGVLWSSDRVGDASNFNYLELSGGAKPYLLTSVDNQIGALTRIDYASSTEYYLDQGIEWQTPMPFPVQVVRSVEVVDQLSGGKLTSEYRYRHGYWDGREREFRGFGLVERFDSEEFERFNGPGLHLEAAQAVKVAREHFAPPVLTRTWFHLGDTGDELGVRQEANLADEHWAGDADWLQRESATIDLLTRLAATDREAHADALRALRGLVLRTEVYARDGTERQDRPYAVTEQQYGLREVDEPGTDAGALSRRRIFFPYAVASRSTQWERGVEPRVTAEFFEEYDEFGQVGRHITVAIPRARGRDFLVRGVSADSFLAAATLTEYSRPERAVFPCDRIAQESTFEVKNSGSESLSEVLERARIAGPSRVLIGQVANYYDGAPFVGEPLGRVGAFGALTRSEALAFDPALLSAAYNEVPFYLTEVSPPQEYPDDFVSTLPSTAGYSRRLCTVLGVAQGAPAYFKQVARLQYDFQVGGAERPRGLVVRERDPLGNESSYSYDRFSFARRVVTDAVGLQSSVELDYRVLQPAEAIDANGNRTSLRFNALGLPEQVFVRGKDGEGLGDLAVPSTHFEYALDQFQKTKRPIFVRTVRRVEHDSVAPGPVGEIEQREFSDGFGRLIQTRSLAEDELVGNGPFATDVLPADHRDEEAARQPVPVHKVPAAVSPNVVVSGWKVYDNKGRPVAVYEPFFDRGWTFQPPADGQLGARVDSYFDGLGRAIRTVYPDGSEQRVIYGEPSGALSAPQQFEPTPWLVYTYDANDLAPLSKSPLGDSLQALVPTHHHFTPSHSVLDALGRIVVSVKRNRDPLPSGGGAPGPTKEIQTRYEYDLRGNTVRIWDASPRETPAFEYRYDYLNRPLWTSSADAGQRTVVHDAADGVIEERDAKGALSLTLADALRRPTHRWTRDALTAPMRLCCRFEYGDEGTPRQQAARRAANHAANKLGRMVLQHDEAGLQTIESYDFKGNVLAKTRRMLAEALVLRAFPAGPDAGGAWGIGPFRVDWGGPAGDTLGQRERELLADAVGHTTEARFDALGRVVETTCPVDPEGRRRRIQPHYNRAGSLDQIAIDGEVFAQRIAYDPRGRRTLVVLGNGVLTRYHYDARSSRLTRQRSEFCVQSPTELRPRGTVLQDLSYRYDLNGNIVRLLERTPSCGVRNNPQALQPEATDESLGAQLAAGDALIRRFEYDALDRLRQATGRMCTSIGMPAPWSDSPGRCGFNASALGVPGIATAPDETELYGESYTYDEVGNVLGLGRTVATGGFSRSFTYEAQSNRLRSVVVDGKSLAYQYDANGNVSKEAHTRRYFWDAENRLVCFADQAAETAEPSVLAYYFYDAQGNRLRKVVRKQGGDVEFTDYIDTNFTVRSWVGSSAAVRNASIELDACHAELRIGPQSPKSSARRVQYSLPDHLGSGSLVVGGDTTDAQSFVNREEYFPYGEPSYGGFARKRYRFCGVERDEESGAAQHGYRYYVAGICRWLSPDPAGAADGVNTFLYARANPLKYLDRSGTDSKASRAGATQDHPIFINDPTQLFGPAGFPESMPESVKKGDASFVYREPTRTRAGTYPENTRGLPHLVNRDTDGGKWYRIRKQKVGAMETVVQVASFANDPGSLAGDDSSEGGGVPGGTGTHSGGWWQALFVALSIGRFFADKVIPAVARAIGVAGKRMAAIAKALARARRATSSVADEVERAFANGVVKSGTLVKADANGVAGSGPRQGQGAIWYHDNLKVRGAGPSGETVELRTHSPNPNAPAGSYSRDNYTTQINTANGEYLLPDGTWKPLNQMTNAEKKAAHYPAGN